MKLRHLLFGLLAGVAFVACTNDDDPAGASPVNGGDKVAAAKYITVDLQFPGSGAATRAIDTDGFDTATDAENAVSEAAFLFFKDDAQVAEPFIVKANVPYTLDGETFTWDPDEKAAATTNPQGHKKTAVVVMKNPTAVPEELVVLVNSGMTAEYLEGKTVADLQDELADFATGKTESGKFVMSNSVYVGAGNLVVGAPVGSENIKETAALAKTDPAPVKVYVERVVAKVTVADATTADTNNSGVDGVKVVLKGWGFAYENKQSYLIKKLQTSYDFGATWAKWNDAANFRSYWADAPVVTAEGGNVSTSYTNAKNQFGTDKPYYTQEHVDALPQKTIEAGGKPTAVIVAAELQIDGKAVNLYKFKGTLYKEADLITLMANSATVKQFYKADNDENPTKFTSLDPATDFELLVSEEEDTSLKSYEANVYLNVTYTGKIYDADQKDVTSTAKTTIAAMVETVQFWNMGATYYYVPIVQNSALNVNVKDPKAETPAYWGLFGVVRNHFYQLTIKKVQGLGTAVPNPDEIIVPTPPVDQESYIAAEINILDWKKVTQDVNLGE